MDIYLFRDLKLLRQTGNFSQAAALGNLSQPAFSRRIKSLEAWVGATLVDRARQPVKLTPAGEQMLEAGLQALTRIEQERSQILELQALPDKYVVSFGAQHSIGWRFYPAWLQALEEAYGPIMSRLRADDLPNCIRDLRGGDVDFVIAYASTGEGGDGQFEAIGIGEDQLIPVCKPNADGTPLFTFDDEGVKLPYLRFGDAAPIGDHLAPLFFAHGIPDRLQTVYENTMAGALRIRARAGEGVAWLPKSLVLPDLESRILVQTGRPEWVVDLSIRLFRNRQHSNRVTRSIWSFLKVRQSVSLLAPA
ncbi:LysR family transcriptional regulator [Ovoidimarina sediminis]|uniref:LysR family transcriptional regulator n=1 Tax=Ovoidimarina sediminis TaxID=3079856 RepID=UPI0029072820|nr:LysR family transcriptional regulator [Rhodophyticola sp. MJ-SS7]MDU8946225.1 LysR family transcriptional regulator [Rhodophyticola sp. MJ-SS7]